LNKTNSRPVSVTEREYHKMWLAANHF